MNLEDRPIATIEDLPANAELPPRYLNYRISDAARILGWSRTKVYTVLRPGIERFPSKGPVEDGDGTQVVPGPILVDLLLAARPKAGRRRRAERSPTPAHVEVG